MENGTQLSVTSHCWRLFLFLIIFFFLQSNVQDWEISIVHTKVIVNTLFGPGQEPEKQMSNQFVPSRTGPWFVSVEGREFVKLSLTFSIFSTPGDRQQ